MKMIHLSFLSLILIQPALAEEIALNATQIQTLGIISAPLPARQSGELAGMPAQVVIPGNQLFTISTPLAGMVEQTLVGVGDAVRKGQKLATLQSPALAEAQRGLLQSSTQTQLAKENLARDEQLWKDGIISESRLRATQSQYREADAAFSERKQLLKLAGMSTADIARMQTDNSLSSQLTITSPIDGVVLEKNASSGQRLEAAIPLFKVAQLEPLGLEIQTPLASTQGLKVGASVTIPAYGAKGKLSAIGRSLSGDNQTILLRALIRDGAANLRPGQFVEASIGTAGDTLNQWSIPNDALARIGGKTMIFVQTVKGFRNEPVKVLHEGAGNSVVSGNLKGDEKIAVRGVSALKASLMGIGGE
ncbi:MAG: efflux RND transporter periplasmic adaptor subunit [Nitrosomonadales bacterium]|nr:efflux RND transporter periplasmic adaptor subunit [Nitrosomonadales bacterium]